jgi:hypothetical protein
MSSFNASRPCKSSSLQPRSAVNAWIHEDRLTVQPDKEQRLTQILHDSAEPRLGVGQCPELLFERLPDVLQSGILLLNLAEHLIECIGKLPEFVITCLRTRIE